MKFFNKKGKNGYDSYDDSYDSSFYRGEDDDDEGAVVGGDFDDDEMPAPAANPAPKAQKPVAPAPGASYGFKLITPGGYQDGPGIVGYLKDGYGMVLNIEELDTAEAQRLIVYLMGALEALDGELKRVSKSTFALAPRQGMLEDVGDGQG